MIVTFSEGQQWSKSPFQAKEHTESVKADL